MNDKVLGRLEGKVAIVTGGGSGIGGAISRLFAREGAKLVIADIDPALGEETNEAIRAAGGVALFVRTDVRREADIQAVIDRAVSELGGLDVLVNNAGIGIGKTAEESSADEWELIMAVNARSTFLSTKYAIPHLRARGGGSIINVGSLFALRAAPNYAIYHASKGAIRQLTKTAALTHAAEGIRINAVHPGPTETPTAKRDTTAQELVASRNVSPMGRWGQPEDIAYGCLYLASNESSFVTGIDLPIAGGLSI